MYIMNAYIIFLCMTLKGTWKLLLRWINYLSVKGQGTQVHVVEKLEESLEFSQQHVETPTQVSLGKSEHKFIKI